MDGTWNVYFEGETVGTCSLQEQGLYYRVQCRCSMITNGICRLKMQCGEQSLDLGIMVPEEGALCLNRSIPAKKLPRGQLQFALQSEQQRKDNTFIPVQDGESFAYLSKLDNAKLVKRNGGIGVIL